MVMMTLWQAVQPDATVRTFTPRKLLIVWGPHRFGPLMFFTENNTNIGMIYKGLLETLFQPNFCIKINAKIYFMVCKQFWSNLCFWLPYFNLYYSRSISTLIFCCLPPFGGWLLPIKSQFVPPQNSSSPLISDPSNTCNQKHI